MAGPVGPMVGTHMEAWWYRRWFVLTRGPATKNGSRAPRSASLHTVGLGIITEPAEVAAGVPSIARSVVSATVKWSHRAHGVFVSAFNGTGLLCMVSLIASYYN